MNDYHLTELVRIMAAALYAIERERAEEASDCIAPTPTFAGEFKYVVDRIDNAEKEDKAKRVDATMADWFPRPKDLPHILLGHPTTDASLMKILQLVGADIISRQEARELLGLTKAEGLRDL